jgi:phosphoglycolate phosphatase
MNWAKIRAVIFDLDGVILDSVTLKTEIFLRCYDGKLDETQKAYIREHQAHHGGVGRAEKFRHFEAFLFGRSLDDEKINGLIRLYQSHLFKHIDDCALLPGAIECLNLAANSCDLYLVSGTLHEDLIRIVEKRNLADHFISIIGSPTTKNDAFATIIKNADYHPGTV